MYTREGEECPISHYFVETRVVGTDDRQKEFALLHTGREIQSVTTKTTQLHLHTATQQPEQASEGQLQSRNVDSRRG